MHLLPYIYFSSPALLTRVDMKFSNWISIQLGKNTGHFICCFSSAVPPQPISFLGNPSRVVLLMRFSSGSSPKAAHLRYLVLLRQASSMGSPQVVLLSWSFSGVFFRQSSSNLTLYMFSYIFQAFHIKSPIQMCRLPMWKPMLHCSVLRAHLVTYVSRFTRDVSSFYDCPSGAFTLALLP